MISADKLRNVAIVAHIDHGKTTLIDALFRATRTFRQNARMEERVMDSNELERERGITIRSKHCTVEWGGHRVNIVDTPGHADFSGEVERILSMVDSVLLLVDAAEGPMPQTRYVLTRSLAMGHRPVVVINKVERPAADPSGALDKTFDLFLELGAADEQADFPVLYGSGLEGWLVHELSGDREADRRRGVDALFETLIAHVPPPAVRAEAPFLMQANTLAWSDYVGRMACGRIHRGRVRRGDDLRLTTTRRRSRRRDETAWDVVSERMVKASHLWVSRGLDRVEVEEVHAGDIAWVAVNEEVGIGDTLAAPDSDVTALPPLEIEEPTVSMFFLVNGGPFAGREGRAVTIRELRARLGRELRTNVALRVEDIPDRADGLKVSGRGELHLAILIEEMRREGMEICVSRPEVITREDEDGDLLEPAEDLIVDVPEEHQGAVISKLAPRKGTLTRVDALGPGTVRLQFRIPTRGLIGYRSEFLTDTKGLGVLTSRFAGYEPWFGEIPARTRGSLVSMEEGEVTTYAVEGIQPRGVLFVSPGDRVYKGQVVGECARPGDLPCKVTRRRHVTNHRSATKDIDVVLKVPRTMTLDQSLEWIAQDELVEVTPTSTRIRKVILDHEVRRRAEKRGVGA